MSDVEKIIAEVVARTPEWLRRALLSDRNARSAAEEALSAMIVAALAKPGADWSAALRPNRGHSS